MRLLLSGAFIFDACDISVNLSAALNFLTRAEIVLACNEWCTPSKKLRASNLSRPTRCGDRSLRCGEHCLD